MESCAAHQENTRADLPEEHGKGAYPTGLTMWEIVLRGTPQSHWEIEKDLAIGSEKTKQEAMNLVSCKKENVISVYHLAQQYARFV